MKKGKGLLSCRGSMFMLCFLALFLFLPGAKAKAALSVDNINYNNSTITIKSDSGDSILYFSDKNKRTWETAAETFTGGTCTIDISWITTARNYEINFKGDKTTEDILSVTIPKQMSKFKAKYNLSSGEITFTGADDTDIIEYHKNNTDFWNTFGTASASQDSLKEELLRLCENGASVYFRVASVNGTADDPGQRASKEVVCRVTKKSAAPTVTIDTNTSKISMQSGWQVRTAGVTEKSGVQYVTSFGDWKIYKADQDIDVFELAPKAKYNADSASPSEDVYLQFRKSATSSAQVSHITTVKVPAQKEAPDPAGVSIEYTSTSSCELSFEGASESEPYEYCIVDEDDIEGNEIADLDSVTWKTVTSSKGVELTKKTASDGSSVFFRAKAVGSTGDDDFRLASEYVKSGVTLSYPKSEQAGVVKSGNDLYLVDGICTTGNASGHSQFTVYSPFNAKVSSIKLSTAQNPKNGDGSASVTSTAAKNTNSTEKDKSDKYIITTTITNIALSDAQKEKLEENGELVLYAYMEFESKGSEKLKISSDDSNGVRIHMIPKSTVTKTLQNNDSSNAVSVTRLVGSKTKDRDSAYQYENFWFELKFGTKEGTDVSKYISGSNAKMGISSVTLGNYTLASGTDYTYSGNKFTVNLDKFELKSELVSSYNQSEPLVIKLEDGEKITDVTVTLAAPVSLNENCAETFTRTALQTEETITSSSANGTSTTTTVQVNDYSIGFTRNTETKVNGVYVSGVSCLSATWKGENILAKTEKGTKIIFSNQNLKDLKQTGKDNVVFKFEVTYSNGEKIDYTIDQGYQFTVN